MTRQKAIANHLLAGKVVNIKTAYNLFGISNVSREMIRLIEQPFGIQLTRTQRNGKTKYGQPCYWIDYSLTSNKINKLGIKRLKVMVNRKETIQKKVSSLKKKV